MPVKRCSFFFLLTTSSAPGGNCGLLWQNRKRNLGFPYQMNRLMSLRLIRMISTMMLPAGKSALYGMMLWPMYMHMASNARKPEVLFLSLIHISEPTRLGMISYAVFCLKKKKKNKRQKDNIILLYEKNKKIGEYNRK